MSSIAIRHQPATGLLSIERYIHLSTIWGVFSGILIWQSGATIFFFYLIMVSNLLLIWAFFPPLVLPRWVIWFLVYLLASGAIGIARGTDSIVLVLKQLVAISLSVFYFANFFHQEGNVIGRAWSTYVRTAYWFVLIAIVIWPIQCLLNHKVDRLNGLSSEPSIFCIVTIPALYWYASQWQRFGRCRKETLWMTLGIAMSSSSTGYLAVAFGLLLLFGKRITSILIASGGVVALLIGLYLFSPSVSVRVDDTVRALVQSDVSDTNLSTYALLTNTYITGQVLARHPILGNGLGSHLMSSNRYLREVPGEDLLEAAGYIGVGSNAADANSLTLRSLSELGLVGFCGIIWFILHFRVKGNSQHEAISSAILTVFLQKILRNGGYSFPEQFFFVLVYILNYQQFRTSVKEANQLSRADAS